QAGPPKPAKSLREEEPMKASSQAELSAERLKEFKSSLFAVFQSAHAQSVKMKTLMEDINKGRESRFTEPDIRAALARMQDDNQVMVADDIIFLI
ncbi:DNA replication licensing factor MCM3-like, partial [Notothenia coriiceps]|uniref:DNA replication licensing factor MCM3-like n=2 Tax=Nototheniidae TaxID=8206 RepID=A0A6I9N5L6_9TELE